jgi:hypothetical protein
MSLTDSFARADARTRIQWAVGIGAVLVALIGIAVVALSFRPSRFSCPPGTVLTWTTTTTSIELLGDKREGVPAVARSSFTVMGLGPEGHVALVGPDATGRERLSLLHIAEDGAVQMMDAAGREQEGGRAIGLVDLALFPLPASPGDQVWEPEVSWAVLPEGRQALQAKVRRAKASRHPEFSLKPLANAIEWTDPRGLYRQVRDLSVVYRFEPGIGAVDQATMKMLYVVEEPPPGAKRTWRVTVDVVLEPRERVEDEPQALLEAARACAAAQESQAGAGGEALRSEARRRLQQAGVGPARLRALMARLLDDLARPAPAPTSSGWYLRLAVGPEAQRDGAEHMAATARAAQLPARVVAAGPGRIQVLVGPLTTRDAAFLERVRFRFPHLKPVWQEGL